MIVMTHLLTDKQCEEALQEQNMHSYTRWVARNGSVKELRLELGWVTSVDGESFCRNATQDQISELIHTYTSYLATLRRYDKRQGHKPEVLEQCRKLKAQGLLVTAIKHYRDMLGTTLREAKDAVDAL